MSLNFNFKQDENQLVIKRTLTGLLLLVTSEFFKLAVASLILLVPNQSLQTIHETLMVLKALPILVLPALIKSIKKAINGETYTFNKNLNQISKNSRTLTSLNTVIRIRIEYKYDGEDYLNSLMLEHKEGGRTPLLESINKKTAVEAGLIISKFLKIELLDNFPHGPQILWGGYDVTSKDVEHIMY